MAELGQQILIDIVLLGSFIGFGFWLYSLFLIIKKLKDFFTKKKIVLTKREMRQLFEAQREQNKVATALDEIMGKRGLGYRSATFSKITRILEFWE